MSIFASREEFFLEGVIPVTWPLAADSSCPICMEYFASGSENPMAFSTCRHVFGSKCVAQLIGNHCPLCRVILWEKTPPAHRQDALDLPHPSNGSNEVDWHENYDDGDYDGDSYHDDDSCYDDDGDYDDYHDYYDDYHDYYDDTYHDSDYEEGEILDDGDIDMLDVNDPDPDPNIVRTLDAYGWPRRQLYYYYSRGGPTAPIIPAQAAERPSLMDMVTCREFARAEIDSYGVGAYAMGAPLWVTVRRRPMGWAWRDFMDLNSMEGMLRSADAQAGAEWARGGDERVVARVMGRVEREALPAIEAWNARREGQVWEVRALRDAWVRLGAGQLSPETRALVDLLSGLVLAWRLVREVEVFGEML